MRKLVRGMLYWGPTQRFLKSPALQPVWSSMQKLAIYGMNYGGGNDIDTSGELWTLQWLHRRFEKAHPGGSAVILDVGAHDGMYAVAAASTFGERARIHAFEPSAAVFETLRKNAAGRVNITINHCGLGDREGTASLYYDGVGSQCASVHPEAHHSAATVASGVLIAEEIRLGTVDAYCREHGLSRIDLLKIDVEGNELSVLNGARGLIDAGCVDAIQFEFGVAQIGSRTFFKHIYQFLSPRYHIHRILRAGLSPPFDHYDEILEVFRTTNYLALRRDADPAAGIAS